MELSPVQHRVWSLLTQFARVERRTPPPSIIYTQLGLAPNTVKQHLQAIARKGLLEIESRGVGRSPHIRLTPEGRALAGLGGLPVLGAITAGSLQEALQHPVGFLPDIGRPGWYGLIVKGNSMAEEIRHRDLVILQAEVKPNPGEICAVRVGDERATLKHLRWRGKTASLIPHNPQFPTVTVPLEEVTVDGVYRGLVRGAFAERLMEDDPM